MTQPEGNWQPIETLEIDAETERSKEVVFAYFGPNKSYYGAKRTGYLFQKWPRMPEPATMGWPFSLKPTHFMPLPAPPEPA